MLGIAVAVVTLVVGLFATWVLRTESGARFVVDRAIAAVPGSFTVEQIEGRLAGPLIIRGLTLRTDAADIVVGRAEIEWQPTSLLNRHLVIEQLLVNGLLITRIPGPEPAASEPPLEIPDDLSSPLDFTIDALRIDLAEYRNAPAAEPIVVNSLNLTARGDRAAIVVRSIDLQTAALELGGNITVATRAPHTTDSELVWTLTPTDLAALGLPAMNLPAVAGTTRLSGTISDIEIEQTLAAPYNTNATVSIQELLTNPRIAGQANVATVPEDIRDEWPRSSVSGLLSFEGSVDELAIRADIDVDDPELNEFHLALVGTYLQDHLELETLQISASDSLASVTLAGEINIDEEPQFDVQANWNNLQWPLRGNAAFTSPSGSATLGGTIAGYTLQATAAAALPDNTAARFELRGRGDMDGLSLDQLSVQTFEDLQLEGTAEVRWRPEIEASAVMQGVAVDPSAWLPQWPGSLDANVSSSLSYEGEELRVVVQELKAEGQLRERPFALSAAGSFSTDVLQVESLAINSADSKVEIVGAIGPSMDLQWSISSPDIADLWPDAVGELEGQGTIAGGLLEPQVMATATGENLRLGGFAAGNLEVAAAIDLAAGASSSLKVEASNGQALGIRIDALALSGEGRIDAHVIELDVSSDLFVTNIEASGDWDREAQDAPWLLNIQTGTLTYPTLPAWQLEAPAVLRINRDSADIGEHCWENLAASVCLAGQYANNGVLGEFRLEDLPFDYFATLFPSEVAFDGTVNANGAIDRAVDGSMVLTADIETTSGTLLAPEADSDELSAFEFGPIKGALQWAATGLSATLASNFENDGQFELNAELTGDERPFVERELSGRLIAKTDDLSFVADLVSELQAIDASVTSDLTLSGTPAAPRLSGELKLDGRQLSLRTPAIEVEDLALVLRGDDRGNLTVEATARSGPGTLSASGEISLGNNGPRGRLNVVGENFEAINTTDARVLASPDLNVLLNENTVELSGTLVVPEASFTPPETSTSAVTVSPDQIIVTDEAETNRPLLSAMSLFAALRVELGERVTVDGFGLQGRLAGDITLNERPNEPVTANGELRVEDGTYEAYGQELEIQTGRLLFAGGPINNPGLDVEAVRRPTPDITVGARVRGTLINPVFTVFSTPSMPRQDQLGYLVLGRSLDSSSTSETSALSRAALALGLQGGNFVSDRISQSLGFDEFGFQPGSGAANDEAAFIIGKYLAPSLYVSYGIGLFDSLSTLTLRYTISSRWELSTESSSEANGGDILFGIERGE